MISDLRIIHVGRLAKLLSWTGDDPDAVYRVFRDGKLITTTEHTNVVLGVSPDSSPVFEVLDDPEADPAEGYPAAVTLQWAQVDDTATYRVDEQIDGLWTEVAVFQDDDATPYYSWTSQPLADGSSHSYRIVAIGDNGNNGAPLAFDVLMVRVPDPPSFTLSYDQGAAQVTLGLAS